MDKQNGIKNKASFSFKNAFFYRQWPDDSEIDTFDDPIAKNLIVLRKTIRKTDLHPHKQRSKMIVRPTLIEMVGNHFIWDFFNRKLFGIDDSLVLYANDSRFLYSRQYAR